MRGERSRPIARTRAGKGTGQRHNSLPPVQSTNVQIAEASCGILPTIVSASCFYCTVMPPCFTMQKAGAHLGAFYCIVHSLPSTVPRRRRSQSHVQHWRSFHAAMASLEYRPPGQRQARLRVAACTPSAYGLLMSPARSSLTTICS